MPFESLKNYELTDLLDSCCEVCGGALRWQKELRKFNTGGFVSVWVSEHAVDNGCKCRYEATPSTYNVKRIDGD